jgi:hypothetical protein
MTLGELLRAHRAQHPGCGRHCDTYLGIARDWTARRRRWAGPQMACTILTVKENP